MFELVVFVDGGQLSFVSVNALVLVLARLADVSCITKTTFELIYYVLMVKNKELSFLHLEIFIKLASYKHRLGRIRWYLSNDI